MIILIIFGVLLLIYVIGKYISAKNKDLNNRNTAQFGNSLSNGAKNVAWIVFTIVAVIILLGFLLVLGFFFGGYSS